MDSTQSGAQFIAQFEDRKRGHIRHALDMSNQALGKTRLDEIRLVHEALPELDFEEVKIDEPCLGRPMATPFYVAGMTAGHPDAAALNRLLAECSAERGWAMGVGSQRRQLDVDSKNSPDVDLWRGLREGAPNLMLFANIGISQLIEADLEKIKGLVDSIQAQALCVHVNALQEVLQPEGTPRFKGAFTALRETNKKLQALRIPLILKETGCGFSKPTLQRLKSIGLAALDVSGLGGTHWGRIEGARAKEQPGGRMQAVAAETFADWGEPTVDSVLAASQMLSRSEIWASGGVRTGLDAAKLIALGAHRVGYAKPALEAALQGREALIGWMKQQEFELRVALFCTGSATPSTLRKKEGVWK